MQRALGDLLAGIKLTLTGRRNDMVVVTAESSPRITSQPRQQFPLQLQIVLFYNLRTSYNVLVFESDVDHRRTRCWVLSWGWYVLPEFMWLSGDRQTGGGLTHLTICTYISTYGQTSAITLAPTRQLLVAI